MDIFGKYICKGFIKVINILLSKQFIFIILSVLIITLCMYASEDTKKSIFFKSILLIIDNSYISKILLIKLDESIELFTPIFHLGWDKTFFLLT